MGVVRRAGVEGAGAAGRGVQETRPIVPLLLGLGVVVRVRLEPLVDGAVHKCGVDGRAAVTEFHKGGARLVASGTGATTTLCGMGRVGFDHALP